MDLPGLGEVKGQWDLRGRFNDYIGHVPLAGKTFLDVGAASGFLSFEAERRGAIVTSFDVDGQSRHQYLPNTSGPRIDAQRFRRRRNAYDLAHRLLGAKAHVVLGDVYDLSARVEPHDIILVGQVLAHLRDPLAALHQVAAVTRETLIIVEGSFESEQPLAVFVGSGRIYYSWWHLSSGLYRHWLQILGFDVVSMSRSTFTCCHVDMPGDAELWTFVARRHQ